jgi:hypothetical protein
MNIEQYKLLKIKKFYKNKYKNELINNKKIIKNIEERRKGGIFLIYDNLKNRIYKIIKNNNLKFEFKYIDIFCCNIEELEIYLISKFIDNMKIDNYGEWEVDHIYPVSKFDFTNKENIFKCFHYTNLQPLWKSDNKKKSNKLLST